MSCTPLKRGTEMATTKKAASDWAVMLNREATAPTKETKRPTRATTGPVKAASGEKAEPAPKRAVRAAKALVVVPVIKRPPAKRSVGFYLSDEALEMTDAAMAVEAAKGRKVTRGEVIEAAIRRVYGKLTG